MKYRIYLNDKDEPRYLPTFDFMVAGHNEIFMRVGYSDTFVKSPYQDEMIVELSTGLFDKNGKEIYEGDILRFIENTEKYKNVIVKFGKHGVDNDNGNYAYAYGYYIEYEYDNGNGKLNSYTDALDENVVEVIGTIHDEK